MAVLSYNSHNEQVCLDDVSIVRTAINHPSSGAVLGHRETWTINATMIGDTAALLAAITALESAYASDGHDMKLLTAVGGTTLAQMLTASASDGVKITQRPSFPTLANAQFVTNRKYTIQAAADIYDGDPSLLFDDQAWDFQVGQDGKTVRTVSGRLQTATGVSAASYFASRDPTTPSGYTRGPKSYQKNHDDTEISYSYIDREHWQAMPAGVLDGSYTSALAKDGERQTLTIAGQWTGPTAQVNAAIAALRQTGRRLLSETITTLPFTGGKSFSLVYDYTSLNTVEFNEEVTVTPARARQVYHEVLGGGQPERYVGGMTTAKATVSGSAAGRNTWPTFPTSPWPEMYLTPGGSSQTMRSPKPSAIATASYYPIAWRYEYEFAYTPSRKQPRVR